MIEAVRTSRRSVVIPFLLVCLIWGSTWLVITGQLGVVPAPWSVCYRFLIAATVMFAYARMMGGPVRLDLSGHGFALLTGIPQFCFNFVCVYLAERYVTSGLVAVVFSLLIVPNMLLGRLILKQRAGPRFLVGSAIAIGGVALLFVQELRANPADDGAILAGIGLTLAGVLSASIGNVIQGLDRARALSLPALIGWAMVYGALANALIGWLFHGPPVFDPRPAYWLGLLYLGSVASALAFSLYFPLVRAIGPGRAAYSSLIIPVIAMLLSTLFEGYDWTLIAAAGAGLTLVGLFVALGTGKTPPSVARLTTTA